MTSSESSYKCMQLVSKYIINMIKMDEQSSNSFDISEVSKDSQLLSLFNQIESNEEMNELKQESPQQIELDLKPQSNYNFPGYWSDEQQQRPKTKNKMIKRQKQVVNKKQKQLGKKRTKLYIEMLENRVAQLQDQNQKLRKLNKINKQYIHRLNQSEHHINGYFVGRQQVFEKLEKLNCELQPNNNKIIQEIISLRMRQGSFGKDRIKSIDYYFKEMVEMLLPEIQKYLIKIALENSDFFETSYISTGRHRNELEGWRKKLLQSIEQDNQFHNIRQFLSKNQERMIQESDKFKQMLESFYNMKCSLIEQAKKIEEVFDGAHKYMSPRQISKILCYIDRYRFEKNISLEHTFNSLFQKSTNQAFCYDPDDPFGTSKQ